VDIRTWYNGDVYCVFDENLMKLPILLFIILSWRTDIALFYVWECVTASGSEAGDQPGVLWLYRAVYNNSVWMTSRTEGVVGGFNPKQLVFWT